MSHDVIKYSYNKCILHSCPLTSKPTFGNMNASLIIIDVITPLDICQARSVCLMKKKNQSKKADHD